MSKFKVDQLVKMKGEHRPDLWFVIKPENAQGDVYIKQLTNGNKVSRRGMTVSRWRGVLEPVDLGEKL